MKNNLILGLDGGGSKTVAWLVEHEPGAPIPASDGLRPIGVGRAGASNPLAVGFEGAQRAVRDAIAAAFADAGREPAAVRSLCLAAAGLGREDQRRPMQTWAESAGFARSIRTTHDAMSVLAATTASARDGQGRGDPDSSPGIALIAGTGSMALGHGPDGRDARAGGWGPVFGDEGGGLWIAREACRAVARAHDGRGASTRLTEDLLQALDARHHDDWLRLVHERAPDRARFAELAEVVITAAEASDAVAGSILDAAATELNELVSAVASRLTLEPDRHPVGLAGSLLIHAGPLRRRILDRLTQSDVFRPGPIVDVPEPVAGAICLAAARP